MCHRRSCVLAVCGVQPRSGDRGPRVPGRRPRRANGGLVGPLKDDTSDEIVSWVDGQVVTDWAAEIAKREQAIDGYLNDTDPARAEKYGFRSGQNPRLAWSWFRDNPVGFNGVPFVLFKTILDLDPNHAEPDAARRSRASGSARRSCRPDREPAAARWTLDHIGIGPDPSDYVDGVARPAGERQSPLPFGFAFENPRIVRAAVGGRDDGLRRTAAGAARLPEHEPADRQDANRRHEENWERDRPGFRQPGQRWIACSSRARRATSAASMVGGKMKFLPGMPNTEIEAQYFSKLLMLTGAALVESGFDPDVDDAGEPGRHQARTRARCARCTREMLDKARQRPETLYGSSPAQIARGKIQALAVADEFPSVMQDLIAVGVKTHFIYHVVAKNNAYKRPLPDVLEDRPGQMDAFGIASGLVAIHTRRPDNSFLEFVRRDNPKSPIFTGFSKANGLPADVPGMTERGRPIAKAAGDRIFKNIPGVGAAGAGADRRQERQLGDRSLPRQLGRQSGRLVAHAGVGRVGHRRSAHGQRAHPRAAEPVHRQPAAAAVSLRQRRSGAGARGQGAVQGELRDVPHAAQPDDLSGLDSSASIRIARMVNTSVSRYGLAALVMEACRIYGLNNEGQPGADWCVPQGDWQARLDEYFRDTPRRVAEGTNGYKADMLHGIWAQAPYLHNGSVPTLGQLVCPATRPRRFLRGNLHYDEALVGFEWADRPTARYGPNDTILVKEYDTTVPGKANTGHTFGADLCPGYDRPRSGDAIGGRSRRGSCGSPVGALLAYLKTL